MLESVAIFLPEMMGLQHET